MNGAIHKGFLISIVLALFAPTYVSAQVTFRSPINTGTGINNQFDNDDTLNTKLLYNCSRFTAGSPDDNHHGEDFAVSSVPVVSAAAGRVYRRTNTCSNTGSLSDTCGSGYGNNYRIDHAGDTRDGIGLTSIYAHLQASSVTIAAGTAVSCSQLLGTSGASGQVTGPHLHFEVRTNGANSATKTDAYGGSCSHPKQYWTSVSNGQPTTSCYNIPLAPSNVTITNATASTLRVNFRDNALNETAILLERKTGTSGTWSQIANFGALASASDWYSTGSGLTSNQTYCYRLRTQNASGYSPYTAQVCGTTLADSSLPAAPSSVSISNATASSLRVNFVDNATNENVILVERKTGTSGSWSQITSFAALTNTGSWYWDDTGLSASQTYCYRLRAQNSTGYSAYSNEACGTTTTSSAVPAAPSNVSVSNATVSSLRINFKDNATNETDIYIERKVGTGGSWGSLGSFGALTGSGSWFWDNTGLWSATTYCYRLRAANSSGSSPYSNEACGTTY